MNAYVYAMVKWYCSTSQAERMLGDVVRCCNMLSLHRKADRAGQWNPNLRWVIIGLGKAAIVVIR